MRRAHAWGLAALAVGSIALTGCEKPAPGITLFTGADSVRSEALCWAFDADQLSPGDCAQDILAGTTTTGIQSITTLPGNTVGISVDPAIAEAGWNIVIGGQKVATQPLTTNYFRFTLPLQLGDRLLPVQIVAGADGAIRGVWIVALDPQQ
ncbi:MAG: hypothetical protein U0R64_08430 [Candidatus Nanopelagicales bacterium]